jgi:hypothetical protein
MLTQPDLSSANTLPFLDLPLIVVLMAQDRCEIDIL